MLMNKSNVMCHTIGLDRIGVQTRFVNNNKHLRIK